MITNVACAGTQSTQHFPPSHRSPKQQQQRAPSGPQAAAGSMTWLLMEMWRVTQVPRCPKEAVAEHHVGGESLARAPTAHFIIVEVPHNSPRSLAILAPPASAQDVPSSIPIPTLGGSPLPQPRHSGKPTMVVAVVVVVLVAEAVVATTAARGAAAPDHHLLQLTVPGSLTDATAGAPGAAQIATVDTIAVAAEGAISAVQRAAALALQQLRSAVPGSPAATTTGALDAVLFAGTAAGAPGAVLITGTAAGAPDAVPIPAVETLSGAVAVRDARSIPFQSTFPHMRRQHNTHPAASVPDRSPNQGAPADTPQQSPVPAMSKPSNNNQFPPVATLTTAMDGHRSPIASWRGFIENWTGSTRRLQTLSSTVQPSQPNQQFCPQHPLPMTIPGGPCRRSPTIAHPTGSSLATGRIQGVGLITPLRGYGMAGQPLLNRHHVGGSRQ